MHYQLVDREELGTLDVLENELRKTRLAIGVC